MKIKYKPKGTCSKNIEIEVEDDVIKSVVFSGGCPGNLLAMSELVKGMKTSEAIEKLEGVRCGRKKTSCPDQLAQALKSAI